MVAKRVAAGKHALPRVLLLTPRAWDSTWGQEKDLIEVLRPVSSITVLEHLDYENHKPLYAIPDGVAVILRKTNRKPGVAYLLEFEWRNMRDMFRTEHDVFVTYATLGNVLATITERLRGKRVLLIYADDLPELYRVRSRLGAWFTKHIATPIVASLAHHIVCTAKLLADDIGRPKKTTYLPNGVNLKTLTQSIHAVSSTSSRSKKQFAVGFVGAFGSWVDFDLLLDAAKRHPDVRFLLVGDGEQFASVSKTASALQNVTCTGRVHKDRAYALIREMDVCTIPFKRNRLTDRVSPIKLFEYWAFGKPVIATRFQEIVQTGKGIVLFADTADEFDTALAKARNHAQVARIRKNSLAAVKRYDWNVLGERYRAILKNIF